MKTRMVISLLVVLLLLAAAPAALAFNDALPAMAVQETGTHDGDPDEPGHFTSHGDGVAEHDGMPDARRAGTGSLVSLVVHLFVSGWMVSF